MEGRIIIFAEEFFNLSKRILFEFLLLIIISADSFSNYIRVGISKQSRVCRNVKKSMLIFSNPFIHQHSFLRYFLLLKILKIVGIIIQ